MNATLVSAPDPGERSRSVKEIFISAFTLYITTIIAARCLTKLRRQPSNLASYQIFATLLIPTFPLAEIIISTLRTWRAWKWTGLRISKRYYLCAVLEMRAVPASGDNEDSIPLSMIDLKNLRCEYKPYNAKWAVRVLALLVSASHALLIISSWIRRFWHDTLSILDDLMALVALGSLLMASAGICIAVLNTTWPMDGKYLLRFRERFVEPSPADLVYNFIYPSLIELKLALMLGIFAEMIIYLAPGGHATPSEAVPPLKPTGKITLDEAKFLIEMIAKVGQFAMWFGLVYIIFLPIYLSIDYASSRIAGVRRRTCFSAAVKSCGTCYLIVSHGLLAIALWNMVNSGPRQRWIWKESWVSNIRDF